MQWKGMNNTHWTKQISQETDKYYLDNYSINFITSQQYTIVIHKVEFESWEMNSNLPTQYDCMAN